ncbi:hypothetical protein ACFCWG_41850 [Streptomyces sp. NPDC056390]|uniref:hypothetical protein n=1 Tax=Streptomyces sp. NPDC056390 TaxID=3345806 RepID=UPI0035E14C6A
MSLILAIAQIAREHQDGHALIWAQDLWSDPGRPPEVRIGAGLAWLCLATDPAPDELRALLTDPGTRPYDDLLQPVSWLTWVDHHGAGLRSCIDEMLTTTRAPKRCLTILGVENRQAEPCSGQPTLAGASARARVVARR